MAADGRRSAKPKTVDNYSDGDGDSDGPDASIGDKRRFRVHYVSQAVARVDGQGGSAFPHVGEAQPSSDIFRFVPSLS